MVAGRDPRGDVIAEARAMADIATPRSQKLPDTWKRLAATEQRTKRAVRRMVDCVRATPSLDPVQSAKVAVCATSMRERRRVFADLALCPLEVTSQSR